LPKQPEVRAKIDAITDEHRFAKAIVDAGAKAGFAFGEGDILEVMAARGRSPVAGELSDSQLQAVAGGRKAGQTPIEYLIVTMKEVIIT
jgi:hypothetical protein